MVTLPQKYLWLAQEGAPKILTAALRYYGTREIVGPKHNAQILSWAKQVGLSRDYTTDEIPWCGLFMAVCSFEAGYALPKIALRAKDWLNWGRFVTEPMLGDVVVFGRTGGGHVGLYVGETATHFSILGGNQGNCVCIALFPKTAALGFRRSLFKVGQPANVRRIQLASTGIPVPVSMV